MKNEAKIINLTEHIQNNIEIQTDGNTELTPLEIQPKAHLFKRMISLGIDLFCVGFINYLAFSAYALALDFLMPSLPQASKITLATGKLSLFLSVYLTIYMSYFFYTSFVLKGKTLGKLIMGLTIINEDFVLDQQSTQSDISAKSCAQRALGYLVCYLSFGTFFVFNFASEDKRGLADYLSHTRTVDDVWLKATHDYRQHCAEVVHINIEELEKAA